MMRSTKSQCQTWPRRRGFTILEMTVAIALLGLAVVATAQLGVWVLAERGRDRDQQAALELADNILEAARAAGWEALTPAWAVEQRLPGIWEERGWQLAVQVAEHAKQPRTKQVTVTVRPAARRGGTARPVQLTGLFAPRSEAGKGGPP
jgi:prepilin-type N-terminal cleavage/methylation domain-containing protein